MARWIPGWQGVVARLEDVVTPTADALVRSEAFAIAAGLVHRARREVRQQVERTSRRAWHLVNLPAGSDVNRVLAHIASLERQVRDLEKRLADVGAGSVQAEEGNGTRPHTAPDRRPA